MWTLLGRKGNDKVGSTFLTSTSQSWALQRMLVASVPEQKDSGMVALHPIGSLLTWAGGKADFEQGHVAFKDTWSRAKNHTHSEAYELWAWFFNHPVGISREIEWITWVFWLIFLKGSSGLVFFRTTGMSHALGALPALVMNVEVHILLQSPRSIDCYSELPQWPGIHWWMQVNLASKRTCFRDQVISWGRILGVIGRAFQNLVSRLSKAKLKAWRGSHGSWDGLSN